jgi:hypothetical protein
MNIFRKKDEILASLGNMRAMKRLHVDTFTENKIKNVSGIKIAESKEGQFWVEFQELNEVLFMNSTILSRIDLKTFKGAQTQNCPSFDSAILIPETFFILFSVKVSTCNLFIALMLPRDANISSFFLKIFILDLLF